MIDSSTVRVTPAQFHEFAEQSLGWGRYDGVVTVPDMPVQPVALSEVVRELLELATAAEPVGPATVVELAGPRREQLAVLVARLVRARGERDTVDPAPVSTAMRDGALLPGPGAIVAGPDFAEWLAERT